MHEQLKIMKENQLAKARNERTALDSEIALLETELGIKKADENQPTPTPAKEFQAARDAMRSPFAEVKK
jgi:hypothetical protein